VLFRVGENHKEGRRHVKVGERCLEKKGTKIKKRNSQDYVHLDESTLEGGNRFQGRWKSRKGKGDAEGWRFGHEKSPLKKKWQAGRWVVDSLRPYQGRGDALNKKKDPWV